MASAIRVSGGRFKIMRLIDARRSIKPPHHGVHLAYTSYTCSVRFRRCFRIYGHDLLFSSHVILVPSTLRKYITLYTYTAVGSPELNFAHTHARVKTVVAFSGRHRRGVQCVCVCVYVCVSCLIRVFTSVLTR